MNATRVFSTAQEKPKRYESSQKEKLKTVPNRAARRRIARYRFHLNYRIPAKFRFGPASRARAPAASV